MSGPEDKPINPFEAARRRTGVHVSIDVHDLRAIRDDWDERRADVFLQRHAAVIANAMLAAGTDVLRTLMEEA